jgi:hypothetical protein
MIPNIFISSTVQDLSHLRDSIRDLIEELGYNPVMSEYGDIGYLPDSSAEDSCYLAMKDCQMAVIIIGKRYGSVGKNDISITHNEFRTAREKKIPVIFLVSSEVLSFKQVYDANINKDDLAFPGMENAGNVFQLISELATAEINNGIVAFSNVQTAKNNLRKQIAHIVGDLLKKHFDPSKGEIKDILSEITTLRHMLIKDEQEIARKFATAFRFLLNEENSYLKDLIEYFSSSLDDAIPEILKTNSLKEFLTNKKVFIKIFPENEIVKKLSFDSHLTLEGLHVMFHALMPDSPKAKRKSNGERVDVSDIAQVGYGPGKLWANKNGEKYLEDKYAALLRTVRAKMEFRSLKPSNELSFSA